MPFSTTPAQYTGNGSAFLTEINTNATTGPLSEVYSTYFGGTNGAGGPTNSLFGDAAFGVTVDTSSNAYIVGTTTSTDFPPKGTTVSPCSDDSNGSAFVSIINTNEATPASVFHLLGSEDFKHDNPRGRRLPGPPATSCTLRGKLRHLIFPSPRTSIPPRPRCKSRQRSSVRLAAQHHQTRPQTNIPRTWEGPTATLEWVSRRTHWVTPM